MFDIRGRLAAVPVAGRWPVGSVELSVNLRGGSAPASGVSFPHMVLDGEPKGTTHMVLDGEPKGTTRGTLR